MKGLAWMVGGCLVSFGIVALFVDAATETAALLGMLGPLLIAGLSWVWMERIYRTRPEAMTSVMVAGFGMKLVFIGAYVAITLGLLTIDRFAFVVSFTSYFIALYAVEALFLKRLLAAGTRRSASPEL